MSITRRTILLGAAAPDREFKECPECPPMEGVPAGKFLMGSPAHEPGRFDSEGPQHVVTVKAFALAKYPVTSAEFLAFLSETGYLPQPCNALLGLGWRQLHKGLAATPTDVEPPRWPAVCLDWKDAEAYIAWLNGKARAAYIRLDRIEIGPVRIENVGAMVLDDKALSGTLIGMSFLKGLSSYKVEDGKLHLTR